MGCKMVDDGASLIDADYWRSAKAAAGFAFMSGSVSNAWRLSVPPPIERALTDMKSASTARLEGSQVWPGTHFDLVFDDGSRAPFCLSLDLRCFDWPVELGKSRLLVYTRAGLQFERPLSSRVRLLFLCR